MAVNQNTPDVETLMKEWTEVGRRITKTYMDNLPDMIYSGKDVGNSWLTLANNIMSDPVKGLKIQHSYLEFWAKQVKLWQDITQRSQEEKGPFLPGNDKRFRSREWNEYPYYFYFIKQTYLLASELISNIIEQADIDPSIRKKLQFYSRLYIDALSPSNFITTNPEVINLAMETGGESLMKGFTKLFQDIKQGKISQTDFAAFEPGKNLATTAGSVIYENELIQLIQYKPLSEKTYENPLFIVPPLINRYYILDLEPSNSFARFAVEQGFTVFMVSWRIPQKGMKNVGIDDYVQQGILDAIDVIRKIRKGKKINALGYCIGGTLLGIAASILSSKRKNHLNSITFLASMHDFSDFGEMSALVDMPLVEKLEKEIGNGVLSGRNMNNAFMMLRANDMIWNYVVNNYLKGLDPVPMSILHWANDDADLPGKMFIYYLKNMVVGNKLSKKNALTICNTKIDLGKIKLPAYILGCAQDHISPCETAFTTLRLVSGDVTFVLGEAGHVAGVVNPPSENNKYGYYVNGNTEQDLDHFRDTAKYHKKSWWLHWANWLKPHSGKQINAPANPGNEEYGEIEPAPGRYVKEHCEE